MDKSSVIYGNPMPKKVIKGAEKSKQKFIKKFGDDSQKEYRIAFQDIPTLDFIGTKNIVFTDKPESEKFDPKAMIVGNIRMPP